MVEIAADIRQDVVIGWLKSQIGSQNPNLGFNQALFLMCRAFSRYSITVLMSETAVYGTEDMLLLFRSNLTAVLCSSTKSSSLQGVAQQVFDSYAARPSDVERTSNNEQTIETNYGLMTINSGAVVKSVSSDPIEQAIRANRIVCWLTTEGARSTPISPYFFSSVPDTVDSALLFKGLKDDFKAIKSKELLPNSPLFFRIEEFSSRLRNGGYAFSRSSDFTELFEQGFDQWNWSFWIAWYDRLLEGKDIYAQELHDILITLTDEDWDKGPAHINPKFDSVLAMYQADRTPNAEVIDINPETSKFRATSVPLIPIENSEIRQKMLDAADTFNDEGGPNGPYAALVSEVDLLRKVALDESSAPVRLYDTCKRVKDRTMGKQIEGACPDKDVLVEDFVTQLEEAKSDVCLADERVRKKAESRAKDGMTLPDSAVAKNLVEQMGPVAAESEGALEVELLEDANILADPNASVETRKDALYRIGSRIPRMISAARAATDEPAKLAVNIGKICAPGGGLYVLFKLLPGLF